MKKLLPLIVFSILVWVGYTNAQQKWEGPVSLNLKITNVDSEGNDQLLVPATQHIDGTIRMYSDNPPVLATSPKGYYIEFWDAEDSSNPIIGIDQIAVISTDYEKVGKTEKYKLVGTGNGSLVILGDIVYVDATGTIQKIKNTDTVMKITISGKIGGGSNGIGLSSASFNSKLSPVP